MIVVDWVEYLIVSSVKAYHLPFIRYTSKFPYDSCTDSKFLSICVMEVTILITMVMIMVNIGIVIVNVTSIVIVIVIIEVVMISIVMMIIIIQLVL